MKAFLTSSSGLVPRVYRHHYNFFRECISLLYIFNVVIFIYLFYFSMAYKASKDCFLCYYLSCVLKSGWGYVIRFQFIIIEYTITSALGSVFYNMIPQNKVEVCFCISQNKVQRWSILTSKAWKVPYLIEIRSSPVSHAGNYGTDNILWAWGMGHELR